MAASSVSHGATDILASQLNSGSSSPDAESSIGSPQCTSTPLPRRRPAAPVLSNLSLPEPDCQNHACSLPSVYLASQSHYPGAYTFFCPPPAMCYTPTYSSYTSSYTPSSYTCCLPSSPTYIPQSSFHPVPHKPVPVPAPGLSAVFQTSPCFSPPSVITSPTAENRPADFLFLPKRSDDADASPMPTAKMTSSAASLLSRQRSLDRRISTLQPWFPAEIIEIQNFSSFHASSIQQEQRQCLVDGAFPADFSDWLHQRYNEQLHLVLDSVERSVATLEGRRRSRPVIRSLNPTAVELMDSWLQQHPSNPYPTQAEVEDMADQGEVTESQVRKWFANKRHRTRKPRVTKGAARAGKPCDEVVSRVLTV